MSTSAVHKTAVASGMQVALHPLVIINITDHYTRFKIQQGQENPQVKGALLGVQSGRSVEIFNSFELLFNGNELDVEYFQEKTEQFKQVFPNLDFLGWYNTSQKPTEEHTRIHQQFVPFNEGPLYLQLDPLISPTAKDLPIVVFESYLEISGENRKMSFVEIPYKIETGEAERLAVNHVANLSDSGNPNESKLTSTLSSQKNAIRMLHVRAKTLLVYLQDVKAGKVPVDHHILREIGSLCNRLPITESDSFKEDLVKEYNDVLLVSYLATITKGLNSTHEMIEKFNVIHERMGKKPRGMW